MSCPGLRCWSWGETMQHTHGCVALRRSRGASQDARSVAPTSRALSEAGCESPHPAVGGTSAHERRLAHAQVDPARMSIDTAATSARGLSRSSRRPLIPDQLQGQVTHRRTSAALAALVLSDWVSLGSGPRSRPWPLAWFSLGGNLKQRLGVWAETSCQGSGGSSSKSGHRCSRSKDRA